MASSSIMDMHWLPLREKHAARGAKFGIFGSWEVPLYYTSILEEHGAVRKQAGLFDISHMGKFRIGGEGSAAFLDELLPRDVKAMITGQALYMPLLNEQGGMVDDILVYRVAPEDFFAVVNAANIEKDFHWMASRVPAGVRLENVSARMGLLALQGPASAPILQCALGDASHRQLKYYGFQKFQSGILSRTGYTGEDGFEIMIEGREVPGLWEKLLEAGAVPAGFGARDTLRLEAGMLLYGHDMNDETTPLEAGIGWAVDLKKDSFVGRDPLLAQKVGGLRRRLIGFQMTDRGIPRQDYEIRKCGRPLGRVTSGSFSPTLRKNIGLGYVPVEEASRGNRMEVMIRGSAVEAEVVALPFYKRRS